MKDFFSNQRILAFIGAVLVAVGGWATALGSWSEASTPAGFGSLLAVLGGVFLGNQASNILRKPPDPNA